MTLEGKTVLVTGATGFLGAALTLRLANQEGAQVRAIARRPERGKLLKDQANIALMAGDVTDAEQMHTLAAECDTIFHVAAAFTDMGTQFRVNVQGTINVAEAAAAAGVRRLVHVSTIATYGYTRVGAIREGDMLQRMTGEPYNLTKIAAEEAVVDVAKRHGLSYSIIRPAMIYGPRSGQWTVGMFQIARRNPTIFIGDGSGHSHPIHVDDVVDLMVVLATHPAAEGEAFNCAPDPAPTWREFLGGYSQLAGHANWLGIPAGPVTLLARGVAAVAPAQSILKLLPDVIQGSLLSDATFKMDKARDLLGWEAKVSLAAGIAGCEPYLREKGLLT